MNCNTYILSCIITNAIMIFCNPTIPVLLLSNIEFKIQCPAMQHITEDVIKKILQPISKLYILVETKLSPEDLRQQNLFLNADKINYCASVTNKLVPYISLRYGEKSKLNLTSNNTEFIQNYIQNSTKNVWPFVYYIYFQDEGEFNTRTNMISAHNIFIDKVYKILKTRCSKPFLVMYTALEPSWVFKTKHGIRQKRDTENTEDTENIENTEDTEDTKHAISTVDKDLRIFIKDPIVLKIIPPISNADRVELKKCELIPKETSQIEIKCDERLISFNYTSNVNSWSIKSITVENKGFIKLKEDQDIVFYVREFSAPYGYSFHCSEIKLIQDIPKSPRVLYLTIRGFQVQLFDELKHTKQEKFSESYDCSGWTTIPILTGLFISAILLIILGIGVIMMLDLKVNDRFENPKKKRVPSILIHH